MNGAYRVKGEWDKYIDKEVDVFSDNEQRDICTNSIVFHNFHHIKGQGCKNVKEYYYDYANNYLTFGETGGVLPAEVSSSLFGKNPLKTEPVFMVIQKDLNDVSW